MINFGVIILYFVVRKYYSDIDLVYLGIFLLLLTIMLFLFNFSGVSGAENVGPLVMSITLCFATEACVKLYKEK